MSGKFIIVSAPSGAGKTSVVHRLMSANPVLEFSVSATSRAPRPGEKNGKEYYFLSVEEFRNKIDNNELLEWQEVYEGQYYGTLKSEIERIWKNGHHVLFDVDVQGGMNLKKGYPAISLAIFILPPSLEELGKRLRLRSTDDEESIRERLDKAEEEMSFSSNFDVVILNDDLEDACKKALEAVRKFLSS